MVLLYVPFFQKVQVPSGVLQKRKSCIGEKEFLPIIYKISNYRCGAVGQGLSSCRKTMRKGQGPSLQIPLRASLLRKPAFFSRRGRIYLRNRRHRNIHLLRAGGKKRFRNLVRRCTRGKHIVNQKNRLSLYAAFVGNAERIL